MKKKQETLFFAGIALVVRLFFYVYDSVTNLVIPSILFGFIALLFYLCPACCGCWWYPFVPFAAIAALIVVYTVTRPQPPIDNPYRVYIGWAGKLDKCIDTFIAWIGRVKFFTRPFSLVEDPGSYKIKGAEIRKLIDGTLLPGDILLRGYDGYLDGIMIRLSGGGEGLGKYFSHAAMYLGELNDTGDKQISARRLQVMNKTTGKWEPALPADMDAVRNSPLYYQAGRQMVVHSMTRGVFVEDILTFTRCDYLIVLRLHDQFKLAPGDLNEDRCLIKDLPPDAAAIRERLKNGESVSRPDVISVARNSALGKIGSCYDFQFNDIKTANRFSCSEFVYYCFKSIHCYLGLMPVQHAFAKYFLKRKTITPADIYDAAVREGKLEIVWKSSALK